MNILSGPFLIPGDPGTGIDAVPPYIEPTPKPDEGDDENITVPCKALLFKTSFLSPITIKKHFFKS